MDIKQKLGSRWMDIKQKLGKLWKEIKKAKTYYLFMLPFAMIFITFTVVPVIVSLGLSFTYYNVLEPPRFVGLDNYLELFLKDDVFIIAIKNTLIFAIITGPISYFLSLFLAWVINELSPKVRAFLTLVFYAPAISGQAFLIWNILFSGDTYGYANGILMKLGIISQPIQWFSDEKYMLPVLVTVILWTSLGTGFLSFIAGFQTIDKTLYEAGAMDGVKNRWQELWYITLPSMKPQLLFGAVMSITGSFGIGGVITGLAGFPSTNYAAHTIVHHLEDYGNIRFEMGYASAIATILFLIMVYSNKAVQRLLSKLGE